MRVSGLQVMCMMFQPIFANMPHFHLRAGKEDDGSWNQSKLEVQVVVVLILSTLLLTYLFLTTYFYLVDLPLGKGNKPQNYLATSQ